MTPQISDMAAFAKVAEHGSFTAAATDMGLTPSAVSKVIARLEGRLGIRLINRTTRKLALTSEGELYAMHCRRIVDDIAQVEDDIAVNAHVPRGRLRISSSFAFANHILMAALPEFTARYPDVEFDISVTDRVVDPIAENIDLCIRMGQLSDSTLVKRKICDMHRVICASPAYLDRYGVPNAPHDLSQHNCLYVSTAPYLADWPFRIDGKRINVHVRSNVRIDSAPALLELAIAGFGILRTADIVVGAAIQRGDLIPLLTDTHLDEPLPLAAVFPQGRQRSLAVRAFIDFLVERFAHAPWRAHGIAAT